MEEELFEVIRNAQRDSNIQEIAELEKLLAQIKSEENKETPVNFIFQLNQ